MTICMGEEHATPRTAVLEIRSQLERDLAGLQNKASVADLSEDASL